MTDLTYEGLDATLSALAMDQTPAEYHGALCGMVCSGAPAAWDLGLGGDNAEPPPPMARQVLDQLRDDVDADFADADMGFAPLLPDDDEPLLDRADALGEWCQGFLFGLASKPQFDLKELSDDAQELIRDLTSISQTSANSVDEGTEGDEEAYAELVEYVRVGAQMLFFEFRSSALEGVTDTSDAPPTLH